MSDDLIFNLALTDSTGKKVPFRFTKASLRDLILQMLQTAATAPMPPNLERTLMPDENPIPSNGFMVTPLEDLPDAARVSIGIGPIDLQFAVLLGDLARALEGLKIVSEPDPTSGHRLN